MSTRDSPGFLLNQVVLALGAEHNRTLKAFGVTGAQWTVLWLLAEERAQTAAELSRHLGVNTGAMSRMLARMSEAGLVVARGDDRDGRRLVIERTAKARRMHPRLAAVVHDNVDRMFAGVEAADLERLETVLLTLLANAGRLDRPRSAALRTA